jgi:hypothetical protein
MVQVHPGPPEFSWLRDSHDPVEGHDLAAAFMVGAAADKSMYLRAAAMLDSMKATKSMSGLRSVQAYTDSWSGIPRR